MGARHILIDSDSTAWDAFDADVSVSFFGPSAGSLIADPDQSRAISYHVHRRQDASGRWVADFTHGEYRPEGNFESAPDIARVAQTFGVGTSVTPAFYDENGRAMAVSAAPRTSPTSPKAGFHPAPMVAGRDVPASPGGLSAVSSWQSKSRIHATGGVGSVRGAIRTRNWVDRYIVTPQAAARTRQRLLQLAAPSALPNGRERFVVQRGDRTVELRVEPSRGTIEETRVTIRGVTRHVTTREYSANQTGSYVLAAEHIRALLPNGEVQRVDVRFSNVRLSQEGR